MFGTKLRLFRPANAHDAASAGTAQETRMGLGRMPVTRRTLLPRMVIRGRKPFCCRRDWRGENWGFRRRDLRDAAASLNFRLYEHTEEIPCCRYALTLDISDSQRGRGAQAERAGRWKRFESGLGGESEDRNNVLGRSNASRWESYAGSPVGSEKSDTRATIGRGSSRLWVQRRLSKHLRAESEPERSGECRCRQSRGSSSGGPKLKPRLDLRGGQVRRMDRFHMFPLP